MGVQDGCCSGGCGARRWQHKQTTKSAGVGIEQQCLTGRIGSSVIGTIVDFRVYITMRAMKLPD